MQIGWAGALGLIAIVTTACSSLPRELDRALEAGNYEAALALINKAEAEEDASSNADLSLAKERYENAVYADIVETAKSLMAEGRARDAQKTLQRAVRLCSWSTHASIALADVSKTVAAVDAAEVEWRAIGALGKLQLFEALAIGDSFDGLQHAIADSPQARELLVKAARRIVEAAALRIRKGGTAVTGGDMAWVTSQLRRFPLTKTEAPAIAKVLQALRKLPQGEGNSGQLAAAVSTATRALEECKVSEARGCLVASAGVLSAWAGNRLAAELRRSIVPLPTLGAAEDLLQSSLLAEQDSTTLRVSLVAAHSSWGGRFAKGGPVSALALIHLNRAIELDAEGSAKLTQVLELAKSAFLRSNGVKPTVSIDIGPAVAPEFVEMALATVITTLQARGAPYAKWSWTGPQDDTARLRIRVDEFEPRITSAASLPSVSSRYFSHFERVSNPEKERLAGRLRSAKRYIDSSLARYNSSVSTHNAYPTEFSLSSVNIARTAYNSAIDSHNRVVRRFNATAVNADRKVRRSAARSPPVEKCGTP